MEDLPGRPERRRPKRRFRTVFLSDIHLGTRSCHAKRLRRFLRAVECDTLYLVGDVIDLWSLRRRLYWPPSHLKVLRTILKKARRGVEVIYVPGNHDERIRDFVGLEFAGVKIRREAVHVTADGRRLLVVHGDEFDSIFQVGWLYGLASVAYDLTLWANRWVDLVRRRMGLPYWSLATFLKQRVKNAVAYVATFQEVLATKARRVGADGVVCGHIHRPEATRIDGIDYYNDGDWVDSCTALVEHDDGRMEIVRGDEVVGREGAGRDAHLGVGRIRPRHGTARTGGVPAARAVPHIAGREAALAGRTDLDPPPAHAGGAPVTTGRVRRGTARPRGRRRSGRRRGAWCA